MSTLKILVIDDEPGIRSGISRILRNFRVDYPFMEEAFDFEVQEASTGEAGLKRSKKTNPIFCCLTINCRGYRNRGPWVYP